LAGFKTFIDPTTISLPGQLVGIVGPNGCGKSNIMESVKWVLGSSSAKEMRGESMESVIFNGTDTRPAISRASVELLFDNTENKVANEWAKYSEIAVRRTIEKDKGSTYTINGINVRRKDIADLFYGTGLGTRGYAMIGQNTISQLVEAKPEELKNFLEEAAGISKYKERRKETEYRLRDTRDNLQRVKDLEKEINSAITKLEAQAEAAKKYNLFKDQLKQLEAQMAFLKKESAASLWRDSQDKLQQSQIKLEQKKSELTKAELEVDNSREELRSENEALNPIQTNFYEISSKVSSVESKIESNRNEEERARAQVEQSNNRIKEISAELERLNDLSAQLQNDLKENEQHISDYQNSYSEKEDIFKKAESEFSQINYEYKSIEEKLQNNKEQFRLDQNTISFMDVKIQDFNKRQAQLLSDLNNQQTLLNEASSSGDEQIADLNSRVESLNQEIQSRKELIDNHSEAIDALYDERQDIQTELSQVEAEIKSLNSLINSQVDQEQIITWLNENNIQSDKNLISKVNIEEKYAKALDSVMGIKSNAFFSSTLDISDSSFAVTLMASSSQSTIDSPSFENLTPLSHLIQSDPEYQSVIGEMTHSVFIIEDLNNLETYRQKLKPGQTLVDIKGNIYGKLYQYIHGNNDLSVDVFATKAKIEELGGILQKLNEKNQSVLTEISSKKEKLDEYRDSLNDLIEQRDAAQKESKALEIQFSRQRYQKTSATERIQSISQELETLKKDKELISTDRKAKYSNTQNLEKIISDFTNNLENLLSNRDLKEQAYNEAKRIFDDAEKEKREIEYKINLAQTKISDLSERKGILTNEQNSLMRTSSEFNLDMFAQRHKDLNQDLENFLKEKQAAEVQLKEKRDQLAIKEADLRDKEQYRLTLIQEISPITEAFQSEILKEQQTKIDFDYAAKEFSRFNINDEEVLNSINGESAPIISEKIEKLNQKIERIGPINMAAVSELDGERERVKYITEQVEDLSEASSTLESAIGKIDRETREKLKETYNSVNQNLNDYFRKLFGGGKAVLELLGNEILDTGLQIVAQPPGKKNTTIHLLSGGEKALTAIALVFALFRLNPAPFCLLDEVDAPLDDSNTERFCDLVKEMSFNTQFLYVSHNKITMELAEQLIGVTMQESGVSKIVEVDLNNAKNTNQNDETTQVSS
tara:strand:+ start:13200 stop:16694 length:3495 start_codon:yes stop_codon:yes gene_type:complete